MKPLNWVILGILTLLSIVFISLYFLLGFNLVDWPQGLVLGIIWWAAILAVGICLALQKRHFDKQDSTSSSKPSYSGNGSNAGISNTKTKASIGNTIVVAILVPTLVLCPYFSTNFSYADVASSKSSASQKTLSSDSNETNLAKEAESKSTNQEDLWFFKLTTDSTGIDLFYSIKDSNLEQLQPDTVLEIPHLDPVEFFVRPKVGYLTGSTFRHSANADQFVAPNANGVYSKIGTDVLPGFENATQEALEIGCTKEFHYSLVQGAAWKHNRYREFQITVNPFEIKAVFDLDGGTLDGSSSYIDPNTYYGPDVVGHSNEYTIKLPSEDPIKDGYTFEGWKIANKTDLIPAGSSIDITNYWRYLYDNSDESGATLPITAEWKENPIDADVPDSSAPENPDDSSSDGSSSDSGSNDTGSDSDNSTDSGDSGDSGLAGDTGNGDSSGDANDSGDDASSDDNGNAGDTGSSDADNDANDTDSGTNDADNSNKDESASGSGNTNDSTSNDDSSDSSGTIGELESNGTSTGSNDSGTAGTNESAKPVVSANTTSPSVTSQSNATNNGMNSSSTNQASTNASATHDENPMSGDVNHGLRLAAQQRTAGTLPENTPFKDAINTGSNALRDGVYTVEDIIFDDPIAQGYGISFANRGCWVCDYLKAGIIITLVYGAVVFIYRVARRNRKDAINGPDSMAPNPA